MTHSKKILFRKFLNQSKIFFDGFFKYLWASLCFNRSFHATSQWIHLRLPTCGPEFESQTCQMIDTHVKVHLHYDENAAFLR